MSPNFCYKVKTATGEDRDGEIEALSEKDAVKNLQTQGLFVVSINKIEKVGVMLTKCKTCGKEVSINATMCPHCGEDLKGVHIKCPRCGAMSITSNKKGFSVGKGLLGLFTLGLLGGLFGASGKDDIMLYCQTCGYKWQPVKTSEKSNKKNIKMIIFSILLTSIGIFLFTKDSYNTSDETIFISSIIMVLGLSLFVFGWVGTQPRETGNDVKK